MTKLEYELSDLLNYHSQENESNTPDYILAKYLLRCLKAYEETIKLRDAWYEFDPSRPQRKGKQNV